MFFSQKVITICVRDKLRSQMQPVSEAITSKCRGQPVREFSTQLGFMEPLNNRKPDLVEGGQRCWATPKTPMLEGQNLSSPAVCMQSLAFRKMKRILLAPLGGDGYQDNMSGFGHCWVDSDAGEARYRWIQEQPGGDGGLQSWQVEMKSGNRQMEMDFCRWDHVLVVAPALGLGTQVSGGPTESQHQMLALWGSCSCLAL